MKNLIIISIILFTSVSVIAQNQSGFGKYGDTTITEDGSVPASALVEMLTQQDSVELKVSGTIKSCCQKKGCWMTVDIGNNQVMRVKFKDYGFFVPMNSSGHVAIMQGFAYKRELTVAEQKHLAKDAGKKQKEINKIKKPKVEYTFMASGVIIK